MLVLSNDKKFFRKELSHMKFLTVIMYGFAYFYNFQIKHYQKQLKKLEKYLKQINLFLD